jgi:hypothetical protein
MIINEVAFSLIKLKLLLVSNAVCGFHPITVKAELDPVLKKLTSPTIHIQATGIT